MSQQPSSIPSVFYPLDVGRLSTLTPSSVDMPVLLYIYGSDEFSERFDFPPDFANLPQLSKIRHTVALAFNGESSDFVRYTLALKSIPALLLFDDSAKVVSRLLIPDEDPAAWLRAVLP